MKFKSFISLICVLILSVAVMAAVPPAKVKKAFETKFPGATAVKWGKENSKEWEAEFSVDSVKMSANFAVDGTWLETETEIAAAELPEAVAAAIKTQHPKAAIVHAYMIESAAKSTFYEVELKTGKKKSEVMLDKDGLAKK